MSALSLPANPALSQNKPATQANSSNAAEEADAPFASVLQQKVQSSKEGQDKAAEQSAAPAQAEQSQAGTTTENAEAATPAAMSVATGEYAQTALEQLLPWLQAMQGLTAQTAANETTVSTEGLLPEALVVPQIQAQQQGLQLDPKLAPGQDSGKESAELPLELLKDSKTASATANLAAPSDALNTTGKRAGAHESFDSALQGVTERLDAQAQSNVAGTSANRSSEPARLQSTLGTPQWQAEFSDHVQFMTRNNESRAELVLTPPQLGRIEVSLNINGDQATAMFVSANPEVRTALEGAMDRLREALANNGISLGQAHVGAESSGQFAGNDQGGQRQAGASGGGVQEAATGAWTRHSNNMLDVFA